MPGMLSSRVCEEGRAVTALTPLGWDTETALIRPAQLAPALVCVTWQRPGFEPRIQTHHDALSLFRGWLTDPSILFVGGNVAYDFGVVCQEYPELRPLVFKAYREDRVTDILIRAQLLDIAAGVYKGSVSSKGKRIEHKYDVESVTKRYAGLELQKDAWRLNYGDFRGVPLEGWPARALEVQAKGRARIAEIDALLAPYAGLKGKAAQECADYTKALQKEREGLVSMVEGDPSRATVYPLDDARAHLAAWQGQEKHAKYLADQYRQARGDFVLHLSSAWGLRTDAAGAAKLRAEVEQELGELDELLVEAGLVRGGDGSRDTKEAKRRMIDACADQGIPVVRTAAHFGGEGTAAEYIAEAQRTGKKASSLARCIDADGNPLDDGDDRCVEHVCLDSDACERVDDPILHAYSERTTLGKQLSNDIPALEGGLVYPVHTRYGRAATGRTTSSRPNIQNLSKRPGFREAFIPRPGRVFFQCDFPGLELYTWAQCCKTWFGFSKLADALNGGLDPHTMLGAQLLGISYEEAAARVKAEEPIAVRARQQAKPGNFGFAGGMGVPKFVATTRKQMGRKKFEKLGLDEAKALELKEKWKATWEESAPHFRRASEACANGEKLGSVESLFTGRHRGRTTYCATCNTPFQGLGADCAKNAMWLIGEAQYAQPDSPLWNTRTVAMVHDEFIGECDDNEYAHDVACEVARLMVAGANEFLPDVPIPLSKMEPRLMRRWSKNAQRVLDSNGRLIPWDVAA